MNKKINLMSPIGGNSLGVTGINILKALRDFNIDVSLFPIGERIIFNNENEVDLCAGALRYSRSFSYKAPTIKIWHPHDLAVKPGNGKYYSLIFLETDDLTKTEIHHLNYCDGIIVPAKWMEDVLIKHKVNKPIFYIPMGVNTQIFDKELSTENNRESFAFFSIGAWDLRNGYDFLIKAFSAAFTIEDKVELRLLPNNEFLKDEELKEWLSFIEISPLKDKIHIYNRLDTQHDVANFIASADCGIFTHRLSTYPNQILECMAMNKPLITTGYRTASEYCNTENSYIIDVDTEEKAYDKRLLFGSGNWAKFTKKQFDQTVSYMRHVYKNNIKTNTAGLTTIDNFTLKKVAESIDQIMGSLPNYKTRQYKSKIKT